MAHPFYNIKIWNNYLDYCGHLHIVTELDKDKLVLVDENGIVYNINRLEFINECFGARYYKLKI